MTKVRADAGRELLTCRLDNCDCGCYSCETSGHCFNHYRKCHLGCPNE